MRLAIERLAVVVLAVVGSSLQGASAAAAYYPTTTTKISSTTTSKVQDPVLFISARQMTLFTTITATSLIPGPITAFPATVVETQISRITFEFRTTYNEPAISGSRTTSFSSYTFTTSKTVIFAGPTDLPRRDIED